VNRRCQLPTRPLVHKFFSSPTSMSTCTDSVARYEFYLQRRDTLLLVEVFSHSALIRSSRPTLSPAQQLAFLQHLVAEGFIPDESTILPLGPSSPDFVIQWLVDSSWVQVPPCVLRCSRRWVAGFWVLSLLGLAGLVAFVLQSS
jgi:hypothetical protein